MTIDTRRVADRRTLRFDTLDQIQEEAERLAASEVKPLGNWSAGQVLGHVAIAMEKSIDGASFRASWWMRLIGPLMKKRFLTKPMPSGFQMPEDMAHEFAPGEDSTVEESLSSLRQAITRLKSESVRDPHPVFGALTREEWDQLHMRHAEMHMSFLAPAAAKDG